MVTRGQELSQILSDLRAVEEISWPSMLIIFDAWLGTLLASIGYFCLKYAQVDPDKLKRVLKAMSEAQPKVRHVSPTIQMLDLGYFSRLKSCIFMLNSLIKILP